MADVEDRDPLPRAAQRVAALDGAELLKLTAAEVGDIAQPDRV
jgi:hypothetical protein